MSVALLEHSPGVAKHTNEGSCDYEVDRTRRGVYRLSKPHTATYRYREPLWCTALTTSHRQVDSRWRGVADSWLPRKRRIQAVKIPFCPVALPQIPEASSPSKGDGGHNHERDQNADGARQFSRRDVPPVRALPHPPPPLWIARPIIGPWIPSTANALFRTAMHGLSGVARLV